MVGFSINSDLFPSDDPSRCVVDTSGDRDDIRPCAALESMLSLCRKPFRSVDTIESEKTGECRFTVVIDLGASDWRACDFCPFCGASIKTQFRRAASNAPVPMRDPVGVEFVDGDRTGTKGMVVTLSCGHKVATRERRVSYACRDCAQMGGAQ